MAESSAVFSSNGASCVSSELSSGVAPGVFADEELKYLEMVAKGGILVEDRWFPSGSSELDRARYLLAYHRRQERNRRRRERRLAKCGPARPRKVRGFVPIDDASQREHRLLLERRKCLRRSTVARCPKPEEIRAAWHFRNTSPEARLRLGGMLLDLECFVDNSLKTVFLKGRLKIVARAPGIRGWIRDNCPELAQRYKTLMRFKALAKNVRQAFDVADPVSTSALLDPGLAFADLAERPLHIQPRGADDEKDVGFVRNRFVWELSQIKLDATGRAYRGDENYWLVRNTPEFCRTACGALAAAREKVQGIILNGTGNRTIENYTRGPGAIPSRAGVSSAGRADLRADLRAIEAEKRRRGKGGWRRFAEGVVYLMEIPYRWTHGTLNGGWDYSKEW